MTEVIETKEVKSGWKTSEFVLTMIGNVAAILATVAGVVTPKWGAALMIVSNGLYAISRGFAKR